MIIETSQLREKLEDELYQRKELHSGAVICYEEKEDIKRYLYYVEKTEELFKKYFGG